MVSPTTPLMKDSGLSAAAVKTILGLPDVMIQLLSILMLQGQTLHTSTLN